MTSSQAHHLVDLSAKQANWLVIKRRYRRSLFDRPNPRARSSPQGPRRLRFSFFLFTYQRARCTSCEGPTSLGHRLYPRPSRSSRPRRSECPNSLLREDRDILLRSRSVAAPSRCEAYIGQGPFRCQQPVTKKMRNLRKGRFGPVPEALATLAPQTACHCFYTRVGLF